MKKYKIFTVYIFLLLFFRFIFTWKYFLNVLDNKDNTITVFGDTSTGEDTAGAFNKIRIFDKCKDFV